MVEGGDQCRRCLLAIQEGCGQPERLGPAAPVSGGDGQGVLDDPGEVAPRTPPDGPASGSRLSVPEAFARFELQERHGLV